MIFLAGVVLLVIAGSCGKKDSLYIYQVDALENILKDRSYFIDKVDTVRVARGETATVQIVLKSSGEIKDLTAEVTEVSNGNQELTDATTGWVEYVKVGRRYDNPSKDMLRSASNYFPDPIVTDTSVDMTAVDVQPLWITVPIPKDAESGLYRGNVELKAKNSEWSTEFYIRVYPVTIEKTSLLVTNWSDHHSQRTLKLLTGGEEVEPFSEKYWEIVQLHAEIMASHGQNVHRIYPTWSTQFTYDNGKYTFDFKYFDREAEMFEKLGALERLEGGHLGWRAGSWTDPFAVDVPLPDDGTLGSFLPSLSPFPQENGLKRVYLPLDDPRTHNFLSQYLPALRRHLAEKGWLDKYIQHIGDEPVPENADSYRRISDYLREYLPGVPIVDAILTSHELAGTIDTWVPILDVFHRDYQFYRDRLAEGDEVWFYTCLNPQWNYANRFIELPMIQTRILHWINYRYDATGYLHWGLNYWDGVSPFETDASRDKNLPAGDNYIIYPGDMKLYSSIRFEAMRDGIYDYELLKMLDAKNPGRGKEIASYVVRGFNDYDTSLQYFRYLRKMMLEELSQ